MKKSLIVLGTLGMLAFCLSSCGGSGSRRQAPGPDDKVTAVSITGLQLREVPDVVRIQGEFQASQAVQLKSDFKGRVQTLPVKEGQNVFIGEVVFKGENESLSLILDGQRAALREAEAQLEYDNQVATGSEGYTEEVGGFGAEEDVELPDFSESFAEGLERAQEGEDFYSQEPGQEPAFEGEPEQAPFEEPEEEFIEEEPEEEFIAEDESPAERLRRLRERAARARARIQRQRALREQRQARTPTRPGAQPTPGTPAQVPLSREVVESRERLNQARIDRIRADMALTEKQMEGATLLAPIDGFVSLVHTFEGALIKEGDPIMDIVNFDPIELKTFVSKDEIDKINKNKLTQVRIPDLGQGVSAEGEITYIAPQLSAGGKEVEVRIRVPNAEQRIKIGMQGEVELAVSDSTYEAKMAPRQAIVFEKGRAFVYRVDGQVAEKVPVRLGASLEEEDLVEIRKGLKKDDRIILDGVENLTEKEEFVRRLGQNS